MEYIIKNKFFPYIFRRAKNIRTSSKNIFAVSRIMHPHELLKCCIRRHTQADLHHKGGGIRKGAARSPEAAPCIINIPQNEIFSCGVHAEAMQGTYVWRSWETLGCFRTSWARLRFKKTLFGVVSVQALIRGSFNRYNLVLINIFT